jgi:2-methylaconitate cis-trans-isomerase PrpF
VRLGHASGVLPQDAAVSKPGGDYVAGRVTVYRTVRRLMEGYVRIP